MRSALNRWIVAVTAALCLVLAGSTGLLLWGWHGAAATGSDEVINRIRLAVHPILRVLEGPDNSADQPEVQTELLEMASARGLELQVVRLDGSVAFSSAGDMAGQLVDLRTALHYDLYAALDRERYRIAFPLIDRTSGMQTGHALFTVPRAQIVERPELWMPLSLYGLTAAGALLLLCLVLLLRRRVQHQVITPVQQLRSAITAVLQGDYSPQAQQVRPDEIGALYAVFDQLRLEILHLNEQRMAQDQAQQELLSTISHELKTPLTTVKAYVEAILAGVCTDTESLMTYVEVMRSNTDKMARLVEDLLLHALQELGQVSVQPREQYSREPLQAILEPLYHSIRAQGVTCVQPETLPDVLLPLDTVRIEQVMANLVFNAFKHTAPGDTIRLMIEQEPGQLKLVVSDTGSGILPQDMPFVFDRYYRGQPVPAADGKLPAGTGLGLAIAKHIVEAHGGTIGFRSKAGEGSAFYFTLPLS